MSETNLDAEIRLDGELLDEFVEVLKQHEQAQWALGDLAIRAIERSGQDSLRAYADAIEIDYKVLHNYKATSAAYPESNRLDSLSWTHHFVVRRLPNRMDLLEAALEWGWSVTALRAKAFPPSEPKTREPIARINAAMKAALDDGATLDEICAAFEAFMRSQEGDEDQLVA